ncbi:MAG: polyprenyl synthetase family protein [Chloroflexota bacterium]
MTIASIYEPIQDDLARVEESISAFCEARDYPWMAEPLQYVMGNGGKRIRPALVLLAAKFHHYDPDPLISVATGIEVFHNATLVHDDFVDKSPLRRGKASVVSRWGESVALLLGDYLFAASADLVAGPGNREVTQLFARTIMKICSGQLKELRGAYRWRLSEEEYYDHIDSKTATLFSTSAEAGGILSQAPEGALSALRHYGQRLGMAFQIIDDILDFVGDEKQVGKPVGSDLAQGTATLPAILFAAQFPGDNPLKKVFEQRGDPAEVQRFIDMVRDSSVVGQCYRIAADFTAEGCRALDILPDSHSRRSLLQLADYVVSRPR